MFRLVLEDGTTKPQYGFFNPLYPGQSLSRAYTWNVLKSEALSSYVRYEDLGTPSSPDPLQWNARYRYVEPDTTPPTTSSDATSTYENEAVLHLVALDDFGGSGVAGTEWRVDAGAWQQGPVATVSECGTHTVDYRSIDASGNLEDTRSSTVRIVDTWAPHTEVAGLASTWTSVPPALTLLSVDATGGVGVESVHYRINGGDEQLYDGTPIVVGSEGVTSFEYWAVDSAGNEESHTTVEVLVDQTAPSTSASLCASYSGIAVIDLTAIDTPGSEAFSEWRIDSGPWISGSRAFTVVPGDHTLDYRSTDLAGNTEEAQSTTFTVSFGVIGEPDFQVGDDVVTIAKRYLGVPYRWGGTGPSGFDASGFTMYVYGQVGVYLPHSARAQISYGTRVSRADLQPGDLVFFGSPISHVGIYVGGDNYIHAPHTGDVVKISPMPTTYAGACRLLTVRPPIAAGAGSPAGPRVVTVAMGTPQMLRALPEPQPETPILLEAYDPVAHVWRGAAIASATADGDFAAVVNPSERTSYRFRQFATNSDTTALSETIAVVPRHRLGNVMAPAHASTTKACSVSALLQPRHALGTRLVRIYRWRLESGTWRPYGYVTTAATNAALTADPASTCSTQLRFEKPGSWRLRAYAPADSSHGAEWSSGYTLVTAK